MPLSNRVDPFGAIHASPARGLFTGNRGVIHDPATKTLLKRRWTTKAWLICALDFKGRKRDVMGRNAPSGQAGWTELFFLDEVCALAAGHRPCFFCRHAPARLFMASLAATSGGELRAGELDERLHRERLASGGRPAPVAGAALAALPDGAMVAADGTAWAKHAGGFLRWSFDGYREAVSPGRLPGPLAVLTPAATLAALKGGYRPRWHPSAGET